MRPIDLSIAVWLKSTYSNSSGGACLETAVNFPGTVPVRDSKNPEGPALLFPAPAFAAFVRSVQSGVLDAH
ncbi:DUF397 domain-containing protein [Streptomyces paludis]|uniref:DUF397 domain-containing protein n=1 Tax=Streptomyces paludis TaxID=2282738 RepID=A0A345HRT5_9ACTN|nr:DUF397 domain-containing protein [Streptomyces paludis]AXG79409.1 DUF397 domain-containing protein [Streptomyces paludis]